MSDKKIRLSELAKIHPLAGMDHRLLKNESGRPIFFDKIPREKKRKIKAEGKRLAKKYARIVNELSCSGARFPADQVLRQMAREYIHRYASSGIFTQPINFNYFEPFLHVKLIEGVAPYAEIEPEFNHLFHAEDFFEYVTSENSDGFLVSSLMSLPQDQIFHFSTAGLVTDISFESEGGRGFVVAGFSMIRRGESLHWYLIGGEALSNAEWAARCSEQAKFDLENASPEKRLFLSEEIAKDGYFRGKPLPLEGTQTHIRTIIAGEFSIEQKKHLSRCYLAEYENSFDVICDDPEVFCDLNDDNKNIVLSTMVERFSRSAVLWSLAEVMFQLPSYFNARLAINAATTAKSRRRVPKKKGGKGLVGNYVVIPSFEKDSSRPTLAVTTVTLPQYEIETEGHWRRLPDGLLGVDRHGNQVCGRTWITSSSKWKPSASDATTIFLKDMLSSAKIKIEQYIEASSRIAEESDSNNPEQGSGEGELYVMRCSAMKEGVYKVGYTNGDSSERAKELSSVTGVPTPFVVVKKWRHSDARKLEVEVHSMLSGCRMNDNREFFLASYDSIERIIESVIARTSSYKIEAVQSANDHDDPSNQGR